MVLAGGPGEISNTKPGEFTGLVKPPALTVAEETANPPEAEELIVPVTVADTPLMAGHEALSVPAEL